MPYKFKLEATTYHLHKAGNAPEEYEDASSCNPEGMRFAIADGAAESSFAKQWADTLVAAFAQAYESLPPISDPKPKAQDSERGLKSGGMSSTPSFHQTRDLKELEECSKQIIRTKDPKEFEECVEKLIKCQPEATLSFDHTQDATGFIKHYQEQDDTLAFEKWLLPLQSKWHASISWDKLPYYAYDKAQDGAFSTFLGLQLVHVGDAMVGFWEAWAVGDCCLFQVRQEQVIAKFPMEASKDFGNSPYLICSYPQKKQKLSEKLLTFRKNFWVNDIFFLTTDALGQWILQECEAGSPPWSKILEITKESEFVDFVTGLRQHGAIRNDDTTLIIIKVLPAESLEDT
ncbi:MAG: hypothetical protein ACYC6G_19885 [Desulfobaccales bacterium]